MNKFNPNTGNVKGLPQRRSIRLKGYDYSRAGLYFVTICCQDRICRFGNVVNMEMILNKYGQIAFDEWVKLPERFPNIELDAFQIMPNHMHGIIILKDPEGAGFTPARNDDITRNESVNRATVKVAPTVSDIIGAYKSLVVKGCLDIYKSTNERMGKLWQRNYYEHIIRNDHAYQTISDYIRNNAEKWAKDRFYKI